MSDRRADLTALLDRVRAATGPDRELDAAIAIVVDGRWKQPRAGFQNAGEPPYTASIDAALALVERVLPVPKAWALTSEPSSGWEINFYRGVMPTGLPLSSWNAMIRPHTGEEVWHDAPTLPLAILAALLSAMLSASPPAEGGER